jgi:hypothetical protein
MTTESIDQSLEGINAQYTERSLLTRFKVLLKGIRSPKGTRGYKEAQIELQRLSAPLAAFCLPALAVCLLVVMSDSAAVIDRVIETQLIEADEIKKLEDIEDILDTPPEEMTDIQMDVPVNVPQTDINTTVPNDAPMTPQPQAFDAVLTVKSPVILKNIYGDTRATGMRGQALSRFGGDKNTEDAVMRALRWLKTQQRPDGGWSGQSEGTGSTGFAILAYLAHGEVPGTSPEFGMTVQRGIEFLMRQPRHDPMATHALAESYGMTLNPNLKIVAVQSLKSMIDRLLTTKWGPGRDGDGTTRPDLLGMAFSVMALRSAKLGNIKIEGMDGALKKLKEGFQAQGNRERGGFSSDHYGAPGANYRRTGTWHFMIGVVGMQYLGAFADPVVEKTLSLLDDIWPPPTLGTTDIACCPVRSNYWSTMVFFNHGGKRWEKWNKSMKDIYVKGQETETGKYKDQDGKEHEIGYWRCEDQHIGLQPIMSTCYIVQQLMVYYRYLPTSSKEAWEGAAELHTTATDTDDIKVDIGNL